MVSRCRKLNGRMSSRPMRWSECEWVKRLEARNGLAQQLQAKIGRGVDQKVLPVLFDLDRLPQALVARIVRRADGAAAADDGNAGGGAGAEKRNDHERKRFEVRGANEE